MKHIKTMMIALACAFAMVSAQAQESANNDTTIYTIVDEMPQFQGGDSALVKRRKHFKRRSQEGDWRGMRC